MEQGKLHAANALVDRGREYVLRLGIAILPRNLRGPGPIVENLVTLVQRIEALGFAGVWVTDSVGRGVPTLEPIALLSALCPVTRSIELGASVVQVPLRHPVELAHQVQTLNLLSGGRLRLGVGAGSTRDDFEAFGLEFDARFQTLPEHLDMMQRIWRGESVYGPPVSVWSGTEGGPPVYLGAWRSERWISLAASRCQGWMASGNHVGLEDIATGIRMFRTAGGGRAMVTSIHTDLRPEGQRVETDAPAKFNLLCNTAEARDRLRHLEDLGFDDAVLYCPVGDLGQLEEIRGLI